MGEIARSEQDLRKLALDAVTRAAELAATRQLLRGDRSKPLSISAESENIVPVVQMGRQLGLTAEQIDEAIQAGIIRAREKRT